ncbi:MAG: class I SAM-dependent methyltransferase [Pseudomonadales bacterium]|nr:class I SAM-dependent methyltransferase [Halioglobus sp.]MCP5130082.1 class I SAM-dependent methyltransferase [Pseudomonadales bacterium]
MNPDSRPTVQDVGLADRRHEGWFDGKTGQLLNGVRIRATDTIVDVGCGDAGLIGFCAGQGAEVIFINNDAESLAATAERVRKSPARAYRAIHSDCNPIPLESDIGDLVICMEVLECVPAPKEFLSDLVRVTRPGGRLLLAVPDARSEQLVATTAPARYFEEPNHIRIFTADNFRSLVTEAGLQLESEHTYGCFWSMYLTLSWLASGPDANPLADNPHPITEHWTRLWQGVQQHPQGDAVRAALNALLPRTQVIVARKPR